MFRNYIKIAWRNLWKNKLFSFINIFGLAIGITCCILIFMYVQNELSYDRYNEKAAHIFRVVPTIFQPKKTDRFAASSPIMSVRLQQMFPEITKAVRVLPSRRPISYKDKKFLETRILYVDSTVFDVFTFPMLEGNPSKALNTPYSIVLTESTAKKYFGEEKVLGQMLKFSDTINLMVTGIIKDVPINSHIKFDCLISRSTMVDMSKHSPGWMENNEMNWFNCDTHTYFLLSDNTDPKVLEPKINKFMDKEMADTKKNIGMWFNIGLQPLTDVHLKSHLEAELKDTVNGDIIYVYIFSATAILILLIACCNFINLSTARSLNRSKEIGLRKVIGALRSQLIFQFLGESLVYSIMASLISVLMVLLAIPLFNSFIGSQLTFSLTLVWIYLGIICLVGILAGLYPALLMSSFAPIKSLKGNVSHGILDILFRKGLVVFQFSIAIILIIGTFLILQQLKFIQNRNIGINKERMVSIEIQQADMPKASVVLKELQKNPKVVNGSVNSFSFKGIANITLVPEGAAPNEMTASHVILVDENFVKTFGIEIVAGRDFSKDFPSDPNEAFLINEASIKAYGWKTAQASIGKKIDWGGMKSGKVVGVVKDFNFASMHDQIQPLLIHIYPPWFRYVTLRLKTDDLSGTMNEIEKTWKSVMSESYFKYAFLEDDFNNLYKSEQNMRSVLSAFTFLSVLVACLGLFGLTSYSIKQRVKEIGVRKVLGASIPNIIKLLSKDFMKLVFVSFIIAVPVGWYAVHKWLEDFAFKISIGWLVFFIAGLAAMLIAFVTISIQASKAASANPVKSLRTE